MLESLLLSMLLPLQQPYGHATVCVGHLIYDAFSLNLWYSLAWTLLLIRWSRGSYSSAKLLHHWSVVTLTDANLSSAHEAFAWVSPREL